MAKSKRMMTVNDVADYLKLHPMTVYKYVKEGKIPAFKIGASWRIRKDMIDKWIEQSENKIQGGV